MREVRYEPLASPKSFALALPG
uniref:Uncharacterized protein n=1 Tax=Rhizophora mucronata TaxID=61149 RepID=A0A2P2PJ07_RHIMU